MTYHTDGSPCSHELVHFCAEDRTQVERLVRACPADWSFDQDEETECEVVELMQAALRSLIAPPKPKEPTGLAAVVTASVEFDDGKGFGPATWVAAQDGRWVCISDGNVGHALDWPFLTDVKVIFDGVSMKDMDR